LEEELKTKQVIAISVPRKLTRLDSNVHDRRRERISRRSQLSLNSLMKMTKYRTMPETSKILRFKVLMVYRYKIGDSFFSLPVPEVQELLSSSVEKIDTEVTTLEERISELQDEMQDLKTELYSRFGKSINLEA
jgi:prefoldin subunit 4